MSYFQKGKYYRAVNGDGTTRDEFKNNMKVGEKNEAPDWDRSPYVRCGKGIHVVEGHPLLVFKTVTRNNPVFFEVETYPNPPVPSCEGGKHRCQYAVNVRIVADDSPEFAPDALFETIENERDKDVLQAAVERLNPEVHGKALAKLAEKSGNENARFVIVKYLADIHGRVLARIARKDSDGDVRRAAVERLNPDIHGRVIARIAKNDARWHVRVAAIKRLNAEIHWRTLAKIAMSDSDDDVRQEAAGRLDPEIHGKALAGIAENNTRWSVRLVAVKCLNPDIHGKVLARIARKDSDSDVRAAARRQLYPAAVWC